MLYPSPASVATATINAEASGSTRPCLMFGRERAGGLIERQNWCSRDAPTIWLSFGAVAKASLELLSGSFGAAGQWQFIGSLVLINGTIKEDVWRTALSSNTNFLRRTRERQTTNDRE